MTITITRQIEITVEVHLKPGTPATHLEPADPADIEILEAYDQYGLTTELTDSEVDEVRDTVLLDPQQRDYDEE